MFSYSEFVSLVRKDGLARQNRFWVQIAGTPVNITQDMHLLCKSANVPGVTVSTAPVRTTGETFEVPYDRTFSPATLTFYADRNLFVRKAFEDWVNLVQNRYTRVLGWYNEIRAPTLSIFVKNRQDVDVFGIILFDAIPKTIGQLSVDNQVNDIMTFDVTFDYHYYDVFTVTPTGQTQGGPTPADVSTVDYAQVIREDFSIPDGESAAYEPIRSGG